MSSFTNTLESNIGHSRAIGILAGKAPYIALAIVFLWFGGMKFTAYEARAIQGLVANSPLISFVYSFLGVQTVSILIGLVEVAIAALLLGRLVSPRLSALGAAGAAITFALTFSFFFSTPGVGLADHGALAISVAPGQFLLKDLALLFFSLVLLRDSLTAVRSV